MTAAAGTEAGVPLDVVALPTPSPLDDALASLGGKASALDAMLRAGLPVPATAVVTTAAYRRAVERGAVRRLLTELRAAPAGTGPGADAIDAAFLAEGVPVDDRREVLAARARISPDGPIAVRSSATTEDLGGASFAGQYRSVIDVETDDEVIDAVARVWASLWHPAPRAYRLAHGIADDEAQMAVILQAMVPAVRSGVVFTIDPGGTPGHLRVEHVAGLGEALVSGAVTPEAAVVPRAVPADAAEISEPARLALCSEHVFATPQDVEWASDGERTWLVQSRPITVGTSVELDDGFDTRVHAHRRYTTAGIGEMLPGVFPVLRWSTAAFMVEEAFRHVVGELGALPASLTGPFGFVVRLRGRAALDLDHLSEVATALPGGSAEDLEQQYFGVGGGAAEPEHVGWPARIRHDLRVLGSTRTARREQAITHEAIDVLLDTPVDLAAMSDRDLIARRSRLVDLGVRATIAEFAVATSAVAAFARLEAALQKHLGQSEGSRWAHRVSSGTRSTPVLEAAGLLAAAIAPVDAAVLGHESWADAAAALRGVGRDDLVERTIVTAHRSGCQRVVGGTTWDEELDRYWHLVRAPRPAGADPDGAMTELERLLCSTPGWKRTRVLTGQFVDIRRQLIRRLGRDARSLLERRETAKADVLALGGLIRSLDLEIGGRLAARGALIHPSDVEHLHPRELREYIDEGSTTGIDLVLRRRRCIERWRSDDDLPVTFTGTPPRGDRAAPSGDRFDGWGASPGRHTGHVRYLSVPDEGSVRPGDVVVARRTDASWSPVFLRAAAIVVEEGGPLSHAAIVARELGLPAVVNVPGVVARLRDEPGPVTVDGDRGAVFIEGDDLDDPDPVSTRVVRR